MMSRTMRVAGALLSLWLVGACSGSKAGETITVLITPSSVPDLEVGKTQQFTASVSGTTNKSVTWSVDEGTIGGSIDANGLYKAPSTAGSFKITATSVADTKKKASVSIKVIPAKSDVAITISPSTAQVGTKASRAFTAVVTGSTNTAVSWSLQEGPVAGRVTADGVYTAPDSAGTYHVVATAAADPEQKATATVTVIAPPAITVTLTPSQASVKPGLQQQYSVQVTGTDNAGVTWSVEEGSAGGTIDQTGLYTAPSTLGTFHIIATSIEDITKWGKAEILVSNVDIVTVAVTPTTFTLAGGTTKLFSATVTGSTNKAVTWTVQEGSAGGTISTGGTYTAPFTPGTYHVVATSKADNTKNATATVTVTQPTVAVTVTPSTSAVGLGKQAGFTARVTGSATTTVTWSIQEGAAGGTVTATGIYTAPTTAGTYHVVATSVADTTKSAVATVNVVSEGPFTVSGTLSYAGARTGRVYVGVYDGDGNPVGGTSVASVATGTFTVRGLRGVGAHFIHAFIDNLGIAGEARIADPSGEVDFDLMGADVTGLAVTLTDPTAPATPAVAPTTIVGTAGSNGTVVVHFSSTNSADHYKLYWSTTANPGPSNNSGSTTVAYGTNALGNFHFAIARGLTAGTDYFFSVAAVYNGTEGALRTLATSVKATAPTTGISAPVVVNMSGGPTAPLYVAALSATDGSPKSIVRVNAATHPANVTLPGLAAGRYLIFSFLDTNNDGEAGPTDPANWSTLDEVTVPATGTVPTTTVALPATASLAKVVTDHLDVAGTQSFSVSTSLEGGTKLPVNVTVTGPGLTAPWDLAASWNYFAGLIDLGSTGTPGSYAIAVSFSDGTSQTYNVSSTFINAFANPTAPVGTGTVTPTFTWSAPSPAPASYTQQVYVYIYAGGELFWTSPVLPSSTSSLAYAGDTLISGDEILWFVAVKDANGNMSRRSAAFDIP
jgi:hypothetical protein